MESDDVCERELIQPMYRSISFLFMNKIDNSNFRHRLSREDLVSTLCNIYSKEKILYSGNETLELKGDADLTDC